MEFKGMTEDWYFESNGVDAFEIKSKGLNILNNDVHIDVQEANAKLMVAAPILLKQIKNSTEVLKYIFERFGDDMSLISTSKVLSQIESNRKAIEKALK